MKKTLTLLIFLSVCMAHTAAFGYAVSTTRNAATPAAPPTLPPPSAPPPPDCPPDGGAWLGARTSPSAEASPCRSGVWSAGAPARWRVPADVPATALNTFDAADNVWSAVTSPIQTAQAIGASIAETWNSGYRGMGEVVGGVLISAGLLAAPYASAARAAPAMTSYSGTTKPWLTGATPNSIYTRIDSRTGRALQNAVYDSKGSVIGHIDFKPHGIAPSGHGHLFPPGQPGLGHGAGYLHIPNSQLPSEWMQLPPGIQPFNPIVR